MNWFQLRSHLQILTKPVIRLALLIGSIFFIAAVCQGSANDAFSEDMDKYYGDEAVIPSSVIQKYIKPGMKLNDARKFLEDRGYEVHGLGYSSQSAVSHQSIYEAKKQTRYKLVFIETKRILIYQAEGSVTKSEAFKYLSGI